MVKAVKEVELTLALADSSDEAAAAETVFGSAGAAVVRNYSCVGGGTGHFPNSCCRQ